MWHNGRTVKSYYGHNLHWLERWSTVGIRVTIDGALHFYINGQDQGIAANDIPLVRKISLRSIEIQVMYL